MKKLIVLGIMLFAVPALAGGDGSFGGTGYAGGNNNGGNGGGGNSIGAAVRSLTTDYNGDTVNKNNGSEANVGSTEGTSTAGAGMNGT